MLKAKQGGPSLTGFSKLLISIIIMAGVFYAFRSYLSNRKAVGSDSIEVQRRATNSLEDKGYEKIRFLGNCTKNACGTSDDDVWNKVGYSFSVVSTTTHRKSTICACHHVVSNTIEFKE